jgi:hypothetical protein
MMWEPPYAPGDAENIARARLRGLKPAETVLVSLLGRLDGSNPQVFPKMGLRYRWDFLKGLGVVVLKNHGTEVTPLLQSIENAEPAQIDLIEVDTGKGWMVLFTYPVKTLQWPVHQVADWLGDGTWHRDLQNIKDRALLLTAARAKQQNKFEPEPVWN